MQTRFVCSTTNSYVCVCSLFTNYFLLKCRAKRSLARAFGAKANMNYQYEIK